MNTLKNLIATRKAKIGILGLGYVGLPLALRFVDVGFQTTGFDVSVEKIEMLNNGCSYIKHIDSNRISEALGKGFSATNDFSRCADMDAFILCVPTPLNTHRAPDMSYIENVLELVRPYLKAEQLLCLESTTYPGTTEEVLLPVVEACGLRVGENFALLYSPEREDPGNTVYSTQTIPKVVGGHTAVCLEVGVALYEQIIDTVVPVSSTKVAELTKLMENIQRLVNIGLANEMKKFAKRMDIDIFEVVEAAGTKPFGFLKYYPGPGVGGHCIPIDPFYLTWKAKEYGLHTRFIELAGEINAEMPAYVVAQTVKALNKSARSINGSKILVLGVAYKRDVDDMRESPAVQVIDELLEMEADVYFHDPYVSKFDQHGMVHTMVNDTSVLLSPAELAKYDAAIITTGHQSFDFDMIQKHSKIVVDTRGCYKAGKYDNVFTA